MNLNCCCITGGIKIHNIITSYFNRFFFFHLFCANRRSINYFRHRRFFFKFRVFNPITFIIIETDVLKKIENFNYF